MRHRLRAWFYFLIFVSLSGPIAAWRSELYPEEWHPPTEKNFSTDKLIQDFSYAGYKRGEHPIPKGEHQIFNVVEFGADSSGKIDSTSAIQDAIDEAYAANGGIVYIPSGIYSISVPNGEEEALRIYSSNIVLRGDGPTKTKLLNTSVQMREKAIVRARPDSTSSSDLTWITQDLLTPTQKIPVESTAGISVGDMIKIEWDFSPEWITEHFQDSWWNSTHHPRSGGFYREVTNIDSTKNTIDVDIPIRYTTLPRDNARISRIEDYLSGVGIENLSIGNIQHSGSQWGKSDYLDSSKPAYEVHGSWAITMEHVFDSWISNVESFQADQNDSTCHILSNGVRLYRSFRNTLTNCTFQRPQYGGAGGNGYMFRIQHSGDNLIKQCTAAFSRHGLVVSHASSTGNVFLQCEDRETRRATGSKGSYDTGGEGSDNHMHFSQSNLWDQCHAHNSYYTAHHRENFGKIGHALTTAHSVYWNTSGSGERYRKQFLVRSEQGKYGYIIGTSGKHSRAIVLDTSYTAPIDHIEGVDRGKDLEPSSLYLDQLNKRLNRVQ